MADVHPQIRALIDAEPPPALDAAPADLDALRAAYAVTGRRLGGAPVPVGRVLDLGIERDGLPAVPVRAYLPAAAPAPSGAILWHHGGGWVIGDLDGFDHVARALCAASGQVVVSVDYRLAPEHPFPAAVEDAEAVLRWAVGPGAAALGYDGRRVAIGGDSAGGQLAALAALRAPGLARAQLLVYPALDPRMGSPSYREFADGPMLTAAEMALCWGALLAGADPSAASVLEAGDLGGAPPAWIAVAAHDPLRDDGAAFARALAAAGVPVVVETYDDMTHGFLRWGGAVDRAHDLIAWLADAAAK
ncbi:MAG TPA: alpha/beta hydrolase [Solirubrobacteraceae bacterium]|nr:alpha/beta hydrolase [Solirubrobacteraceae bacterium]